MKNLKDIAKILSLLLVVLLILPVAKISIEESFMGSKYEMKEYMNYFSVGLGLDQTIKAELDGETTDKEKVDLSGSFVALLALLLIIGGAVFLNVFYAGDDQSKYIVIGIYGALALLLLILPGAVDNLKIEDESIVDTLGKDSLKMTFFYFISLLSSLGVLGIYAKDKFIDNK